MKVNVGLALNIDKKKTEQILSGLGFTELSKLCQAHGLNSSEIGTKIMELIKRKLFRLPKHELMSLLAQSDQDVLRILVVTSLLERFKPRTSELKALFEQEESTGVRIRIGNALVERSDLGFEDFIRMYKLYPGGCWNSKLSARIGEMKIEDLRKYYAEEENWGIRYEIAISLVKRSDLSDAHALLARENNEHMQGVIAREIAERTDSDIISLILRCEGSLNEHILKGLAVRFSSLTTGELLELYCQDRNAEVHSVIGKELLKRDDLATPTLLSCYDSESDAELRRLMGVWLAIREDLPIQRLISLCERADWPVRNRRVEVLAKRLSSVSIDELLCLYSQLGPVVSCWETIAEAIVRRPEVDISTLWEILGRARDGTFLHQLTMDAIFGRIPDLSDEHIASLLRMGLSGQRKGILTAELRKRLPGLVTETLMEFRERIGFYRAHAAIVEELEGRPDFSAMDFLAAFGGERIEEHRACFSKRKVAEKLQEIETEELVSLFPQKEMQFAQGIIMEELARRENVETVIFSDDLVLA